MPDRLRAAAAGPVLILAPTGRDADGASALLNRDGIASRTCPDLEALCDAIGQDTGMVLVADEALARANLDRLSTLIGTQPPWSDLPFMVLTQSGAAARRAIIESHLPETLGNVVFLERPLNAISLISAVRSALRARQRQHQVSAYLLEQKRAEAALLESEARFRQMADNAPVMIFTSDPSGSCTWLSRNWYAFTGQADAEGLGRGWHAAVHADDRPGLEQAFHDATGCRNPIRKEFRLHRADGTYAWVLAAAAPRVAEDGTSMGYIGSMLDISDRKRLESELLRLNDALERRVEERTAELMAAEAALHQAQKMEAVGQLTGGIAHDFNNMLQAIGSSLELMRRRVTQGRAEEVIQFVEGASKTVDRAAALTHRLLAFARRQALQPIAVGPGDLIKGMTELIRGTVGPGITIELHIGDAQWSVLCDPNQLENALLNLAINARDAMPGGGTLTFRTEDVRLNRADMASHEGAKPGDYVVIVVADTGSGMDEATRLRAFEPFFTTKPLGQGTGLGLSQLYGFVQQSGGVVRLASAPGQGTTIGLYLPRHGTIEQCDELSTPQKADLPQADRRGTVLLVEDEAGVRAMTAEVLRELGYAVLEAEDGSEALRWLRDSPVDMMVTDVGLPNGLNGRQIAEVAREHRPGLPVLFVTGYAGTSLDGRLDPGMAVISKPFTLDLLAERVQRMLEAATMEMVKSRDRAAE